MGLKRPILIIFSLFSAVFGRFRDIFAKPPCTIMAVNGSRLHCAKDGHTEWMKCLSELKELKQHQRGSTIFFGRKYKEVAVKVAAFAFCLAESVNGVSKKCVINC